MRFSNPKIPEEGQQKLSALSQVKEGTQLGVSLLIIFAVLGLLFYYAGTVFGKFIPFKWEKNLAVAEIFPLTTPHPPKALAKEQALQLLADKIVVNMELDPEITITVNYRDHSMVNAFAGFDGNIYVLEGLLGKLKTEEEVAALLAHEIGHIKERHIMQTFSANILIGITFSAITGDSGAVESMGQAVLMLEGLQFTRGMEEEADAEALKAVSQMYGAVGGFISLFQALDESTTTGSQSYQFLLTHPYAETRVAKALEFGEENGLGDDAPKIPWDATSE